MEEEKEEALEQKLKRLAAFEKAYGAIKEEAEDSARKLEELKKKGRTGSVTFRQLLAKKVNAENVLKLFEIYGIND